MHFEIEIDMEDLLHKSIFLNLAFVSIFADIELLGHIQSFWLNGVYDGISIYVGELPIFNLVGKCLMVLFKH